MFADALSAPKREYEQGSIRGVLSGDWNSPYCVSVLEQALCKVFIKVVYPRRILQKHIKRQIISLNGGFQVIADLNSYYAFITSLKVSDSSINLKTGSSERIPSRYPR